MQKQNDEALVQEMQRRLGMADEELETAERTARWPDTTACGAVRRTAVCACDWRSCWVMPMGGSLIGRAGRMSDIQTRG